MEFVSSLKVLGWFVQMLSDKSLTATLHHSGVIADKPDLYEALQSLLDELDSVQAMLSLAQSFGSQDIPLELLEDLMDAAYDADDLLSEVDYYRLEKQVNDSEDENLRKVDYRLQKASKSSTLPSFHDRYKATIVLRIHQIVFRLEHLVTDFSQQALSVLEPEEDLCANPNVFPAASYPLTASSLLYNQTMFLPSIYHDNRLELLAGDEFLSMFNPSDHLEPEKVYGRDNERDHTIEMMLSAKPEGVSVIPIVGMGGVGKTTLASTIYNDERVKNHFHCSMWIYVSYSFDVARVTREMLEELKVDGFHHITNLNTLQVLLKEKLKSKRFLLVLDDVWIDSDMEKWDLFSAPLQSDIAGSIVLMTTRLAPDASIMGKGRNMGLILLQSLPDEEFLPFFYKCAFGREDPQNPPELADPELLETGRQIACKLSGSPLAAKTVGGLLRNDINIRDWRSILGSEVWQLPQNQRDIIPVLSLSYQHLSAHLQQCFTFCSVFPKGWHFRQDEMVAMWISHGYIVKSRGNNTLEDIGKGYFGYLVSRSFFQTGEPTKEMFVVSNLMHDLAVYVSEHECLRFDRNMPRGIPARIRHLFVHSSDLIHLTDSNLRNLRTLVIHQDGDIADGVFEKVLKGLNSIRVLVCHPSLQSLPSNVCQLIHLRYLKLVISHYVTQIPDSWCKLFHLQWMNFERSSGLLSLPLSMNELVSLRRFFGDGRKFGMIVGIGKLTCLQELESFSIANDEGRKLGELKMLKDLGGSLEIRYLENVITKDQALEAELSEKKRIQGLQLHCNVSHESSQVAEQVFEGLSPPDYIKSLVIDGYGGVKSPIWMVTGNPSVSSLQSLCLYRCLKWKDLPPLGQLRLLTNLEIRDADAVEEIGTGLYGTGDAQRFPRLETLVIKFMPQLTVWSGVEEHQLPLFPRLRTLTVMGCPQLQLLPMKELATLEELETDHMPLLENLQNLGIFKILKISGCNELKSLPPLPTSLIELNISHCHELITLFNMELEETLSNLTSLKMLSLYDCPLFTFPSAKLKWPPSLKKLIIKGCGSRMSVPFVPGIEMKEIA